MSAKNRRISLKKKILVTFPLIVPYRCSLSLFLSSVLDARYGLKSPPRRTGKGSRSMRARIARVKMAIAVWYLSRPYHFRLAFPTIALPFPTNVPVSSVSLRSAIETHPVLLVGIHHESPNSYKYKAKLPPLRVSSLSAHKRGRLPRERGVAQRARLGWASFAWFLNATYKLMRRMGGGKSSLSCALDGASLFKRAIFRARDAAERSRGRRRGADIQGWNRSHRNFRALSAPLLSVSDVFARCTEDPTRPIIIFDLIVLTPARIFTLYHIRVIFQ